MKLKKVKIDEDDKLHLIGSLDAVLLQFHDELRYDITCFLFGVIIGYEIWLAHFFTSCVDGNVA